uniref:CLASP N-terminal domain-containing protein n=1 Tax=Ditylenchus dipsaci TaxID=166011 RepID=A0A915D3Y0_9BILA
MNPSSSRAGMNTPKRGGSAVSAGSITDEQFRAAFEAVEHVRINSSSSKELLSEFQKHCAILENTNNDWSKRNKSLQALRSLMMQNAAENHEFVNQCYQIVGAALSVSVKDLRSQVCREACITIAYFCTKMGTNFWKVAELVLQRL